MSQASSFVVGCRQWLTTVQAIARKRHRRIFLYVVSPLLDPPPLLLLPGKRDDVTTRRHNKTIGLRARVSSKTDDILPALSARLSLYPNKEGNLLLRQLDGCGELRVRATSQPLTTRDQQGRQQADTPLLGCKGGLERSATRAVYTSGGSGARQP